MRAFVHFMIETLGAIVDAIMLLGLPFSLHLFPKGRGRPILLIPGLFSNDHLLRLLARFLRKQGYYVETWGLGWNVGRHTAGMTAVARKVRAMQRKTGMPVTLVGHSLGGLYALYVAIVCGSRRVRSVITLGSPIQLNIGKVAWWTRILLEWLSGESIEKHTRDPRHARRLARIRTMPRDIPVTTVAARYDKVVGNDVCHYTGAEGCAHYVHWEVPATHNSLVVNRAAMGVVLSRAMCDASNEHLFDPASWNRMGARPIISSTYIGNAS